MNRSKMSQGPDKSLVRKKHKRILEGTAPRTLDLFAGCGGLTLGFEMAGFHSIGAVEFDKDASRSHALNFMSHLDAEKFERHAQPKDITSIEPEALFQSLGYHGSIDDQVDVIVGGPPCQAFARVGRAKLREVAAHPEAFLKDPRGNLYLRYLHYVRKLKPIAIVMENVPDVLNYGGHNIAEETCEILESWNYVCSYTILNSVHYGVPQLRERMFLVAVAKPIAESIRFPEPSHAFELPKGYRDTRKAAIRKALAKESTHYVELSNSITRKLKPAITAHQALDDLPRLTKHLQGPVPKVSRSNPVPLEYGSTKPSPYAKFMRDWRGKSQKQLIDHVIRYLPRDFPIFKLMKPGDEYPQAHAIAQSLFKRSLAAYSSTHGRSPSPASKAYKELEKAIVPPYDVSKFPNKWRKMEADAPARTLMAHLGKDGYSHIHYDSSQARTISIREAARLQSFPDGFQYSGPVGAAYRQIGNAVPPLIAKAIGTELLGILRENS